MRNLSHVLVAIVLVASMGCDDDGGGNTSLNCENLSFQASGGDVVGAWKVESMCISEVDATRFGLCSDAEVIYEPSPRDLRVQYMADGTVQRSGVLDVSVGITIPRSCTEPTCSELDESFSEDPEDNGQCVESIETCECDAMISSPAAGGSWKVENQRLFHRSAQGSSWGDGLEYQVTGTHLVVKNIADQGFAIFYIHTRQ